MSIVQSLLKQLSADINQVGRSDRSILSWAAGEGARRTLKVLLRHSSVDINLKDEKGRSALSWAAGNGQNDVVMTLLRRPGIEKAKLPKTTTYETQSPGRVTAIVLIPCAP